MAILTLTCLICDNCGISSDMHDSQEEARRAGVEDGWRPLGDEWLCAGCQDVAEFITVPPKECK